MKNGWHTRKLGELCRIRTGKKDVNEGDPDGVYPFFTCATQHTYSDCYSFDTEALLIAGNGDVGKVSYYEGKFEAYQRTYVLSDFANILCRFLFHILDGKLKDTVSKQKLGNTMPYIKVGMLTDFELPVPPIPEQHRIVGILDEAFAAIATAKANAEKNLQDARALFESAADSIFDHLRSVVQGKPLGEVVEGISTGPFGSLLHKSDYEEGGIPLVNPININGDKIVPDARKAVDRGTAIRLSRYRLNEGDVVTARRGEIGRCAFVTSEQAGWICGTGSFFIRPGPSMDSRFLTHLIRSTPYRSKLEGLSDRATMPSIGNDDLASLFVHVPCIEEQREVETSLSRLSAETKRLESIYQRKLVALDELKKSLLHQAFSGRL